MLYSIMLISEGIILLLSLFDLLTNHSFNKVGILFGSDIDKTAGLPMNTNWNATATASIFTSIGKVLVTFSQSLNLRYMLVILFVCNGFFQFMSFCSYKFFSGQTLYWVFIICRNLQGLVAGLQFGVNIGIISYSKRQKIGFANFNGISALVSCFTVFGLYYISFGVMGTILLILNLVASIVLFFKVPNIETTPTGMITTGILEGLKNLKLWIYSMVVGALLGLILIVVREDQFILKTYFQSQETIALYMQNWGFGPYSNLFTNMINSILLVLPFIASAVVSFQYYLLQKKYILWFASLGFAGVTIGLCYKSLIIYCMGIFCVFPVFAILNPLVIPRLTSRNPNTQFITSILFTALRTMFTFLTMYMVPMFCHAGIGRLKLSMISILVLGIISFILLTWGEKVNEG